MGLKLKFPFGNVSAGEAGVTVIIGIVLVLGVLVLLTLIFWAFGRVMERLSRKNTPPVAEPPAKAPAPPTIETATDDEDEVVAVIAAAVAAMAPEHTQYTVRRIREVRTGTRSVWAAAGVAENTRPF